MITKGQKINDRYEVIKSIGEGGMANVYLGYDTILDRNVAIKVLRGDLANDEKFVRRFQREALSASSLAHPNIVEMYDVGEDDGTYYIVMEYVDGKTLKQLLKKRGTLTLSEAIDIMSQLTDGMAHAHDSYIIHRDLKPQNIMIKDDGQIKITDFGIAMALNSTQLTQTNSVMGSVHYLPPEQASGKGATIQSDVYSMGILMYELLTGELPFRGDNAVEIALKHIKEPFPSVRDKVSGIPQSIDNIIMKATAKNVKNRYQDAKEMHDDLKTALSDARANEPRYVFDYPEDDIGDKKKQLEEAKKEEYKEPVSKKDIKKEKELEKEVKKLKEENKELKEKNEEMEGDVDIKAKLINEKELRKEENKLLRNLGIVFTALVLIVTLGVFLIPKLTSTKEVEVPDVSGMTIVEAEKALKKLGFVVADETKQTSSTDITEGNVVKTAPAAGSTRKKGAEITLYISSGENGYIVEDLTKQNYLEVKGVLEKTYGLYVKTQKVEVDDSYNADEIVKTEPAAGAKLVEGDTITLFIPDLSTVYPDFTNGNYSLSDIEKWCDKHGVVLSTSYVETDAHPQGKIYAQSITAGTTVMTGQSLKITIADAVTDGTASEIDNEVE